MLSHSKKKSFRIVCLLCLTAALLLPHIVVPASAARSIPSTRTVDTAAPDGASIPTASTDLDAAIDHTIPAGLADFSNPDSEATVELSASTFISMLTGEMLSEVESTYVGSMLADRPFLYGNAIPMRAVETTFEHNTLTIIAHPHSYVAVSGERVTWTPSAAMLGDMTCPLSPLGNDGTRQGVLENVPEAASSRLEVRYTCTIAVPDEIADAYINYAWNYAQRLTDDYAAYEARLAAYEAYCAYLSERAAYDLACKEWQVYLVAKEKYDRLQAEYVAYEQAMKDYYERLSAYEAYRAAEESYEQRLNEYETAYAAYVAAQNAYNQALPLYETNHAMLLQAADILATLDSAFVYNSRGKQMYATLIGDTVATVVNRKSELVSVGKCDPKDIDTAAQSTAVLQDLLTQYKGIGDLPRRFAFYQTHYPEIRQNFIELYGSLRSLYNNDVVKSTLINYDKLERFIEFLSQLYVISTGLDDDQNRADNWVIYGRYDSAYYGNKPHTFQTELEPSQIPTDKNNANPAGVSCPDTVMPKPTAPTLTVTKPEKPEPVPYPVEPEPVMKPTAPTPMAEPVAPTPVEDPGDKPLAPAHTLLQQQLMAAHRDGTLTHRSPENCQSLSLQTVLSRPLSMQNKRLVEFYDYDGQTLLLSTELEDGSPIVYEGTLPERAASDKHTFRFVGWKNQDGQLLSDLGTVDEHHEVFYASYEATLRNYAITWVIDGQPTVTHQPYGSIPHFDGTPEKTASAQYDYVFTGWRVPGEDGWSMDLVSVIGDATYEAVFEEILRRYTVTWVYGEGEENTSSTLWDYGTVPTPDRAPVRAEDDRYIYEFSAWDQSPAAVTGDITYTALYTAIPILPSTDSDAAETPPQAPILRDEVYTATIPASGLRVDRLFELALLRDRTVALTSTDQVMSLHLNHAILTDLQTQGGTYIHIDTTTRAGDGGYAIRFLNAEKEPIQLHYPVTLRIAQANAYMKLYGTTDATDAMTVLPATYENGELTAKISQSMTVYVIGEYPVTVEQNENSMLKTDHTVAVAGDTVTLTLTLTDDYCMDTIRILGTLTGKTYPFAVAADGRYSFTMPEEPVTISAVLSRRTFTVTFSVDGKVISSAVYHKGDTVKVPADPTKAPVGNRVFTFIGWSPIITVVTEDIEYTATFRESEQGGSHTYIPPDSHNREYLLYIEAGLLLALLIATPIVIVKLVKRRRRKRLHASDSAEENPPPANESPDT